MPINTGSPIERMLVPQGPNDPMGQRKVARGMKALNRMNAGYKPPQQVFPSTPKLSSGQNNFDEADAVSQAQTLIDGSVTTIDGLTLTSGMVVLLTAQTDATQNGLWNVVASNGAWTKHSSAGTASSTGSSSSSGGGTGTVTSVTGTGALTSTGGTTPILSVLPAGITAAMLASGAAASNLGAAGGDLTGTYPNPTLATARALASRLINTTAPITGGGDLTADRTIAISAATATTAGAVPTPPNDATKFLRGDATWAVPAGGGTVTSVTGTSPIVSSGGATPAISISTMTDGQIIVGKTSSNPQIVTPTGDVTITNAGVTAIGASKVLNSMINSVDASKFTGTMNAANMPNAGVHTGDATTTFPAVTISANAITLAKMATIAQDRIIGGATGAGTATPTALSVLPTGCVPAFTGDVTNSAGSLAMAIGAGKVTNAMLAAQKFLFVATQVVVHNTGLTNITDLTFTLAANHRYNFILVLEMSADNTGGGVEVDFAGGSATMNALRYTSALYDQDGSFVFGGSNCVSTTQIIKSAGAAALLTRSGQTTYSLIVHGYMESNAGGTFIPRFAQSVSNLNSYVDVGSYLWVIDNG